MVEKPPGIKEIFKELESEFPVDSWVIDQFNVWPLIHICLVRENREREKKTIKKKVTDTGKLKYLRLLKYNQIIARDILCLFNCLKNNSLIIINNNKKKNSAELLFKTRPNNKRISFKGRYFDVFLDPFIICFQKLGFGCLVLEEIENQPLKNPGYYRSVIIDPSVIKFKYINKLTKAFNKKSKECIIKMDLFSEFLTKLDEYKISRRSLDLQNLIKMVVQIKNRARIYEKILPVNCKAAFITVYAARNNLAFTYACKKLGIITIDVAHGANYHNEASAWVKLPHKGYQCLPNIFWCWTSSEANEINNATNAGTILSHKAIAGGNLFLELSIKDRFETVTQARKDIMLQISKLNNVKHILISLQPGSDENDFYKLLIEKSPAGWCWWLRLHPRMLNRKAEIIEAFEYKNVNINQATDSPLYSLLPNMDLHITSTSSVTIEAARLNVPSLLWGNQGCNNKKYVEKGIVKYVSTVGDLIHEIEKDSFNREHTNKIETIDHLKAYNELISDIGL